MTTPLAEPLCKYFGRCGGCSAQNIDYDIQVQNKAKKLSDQIGFPLENIKIITDNQYNYRNRMDFIFCREGLGLREKGNWKRFVDIESCPIADQKINMLLKEVRDNFSGIDFFDVQKSSGTFRYAVIRVNKTSSISFVLNDDSSGLGAAIDKIKEYTKISSADNVIVTYVPKITDSSISDEFYAEKGEEFLEQGFLGKDFKYSVQGFFQNNTAMARKMHEYVSSVIKQYDSKECRLLDLYCGVGTFGIINSENFKSVTMVEGDKNCVDAAQMNIKLNNITNASAVLLDAMSIKKLDLAAGDDLFVITDPPRAGMHPKTIDHLKSLKPKVIIYISCNVEQLGKDILKFSGYELKSAAMLDLFPQTPHIEAVVELVRKI